MDTFQVRIILYEEGTYTLPYGSLNVQISHDIFRAKTFTNHPPCDSSTAESGGHTMFLAKAERCLTYVPQSLDFYMHNH